MAGFRTGLLALLLWSAAAHQVSAQTVVRAGSFEVGPFVGGSIAGDSIRAIGGGNVTYALTKRILSYVEYSYLYNAVGGTTTNGRFTGSGQSYSLHLPTVPLSDTHAGLHIRFPVRETPLVPYASIGLGTLRYGTALRTAIYSDASGNRTSIPIPVQGSVDFALNFGGGVRYYFSQRFGIRVEAKAYRHFTNADFSNFFGKAEAGFFFQLH